MSYPKNDPVPESEIWQDGPELFTEVDNQTEAAMFREEHPGHHSVCQTLRDIYRLTKDVIQDEDQDTCEEMRTKLRLAWAMMKRMNDRLHYYKNKYEPWRGRHA